MPIPSPFFIYLCSPVEIAQMLSALHLGWKGCTRFLAQVLEGEAVDGGETNLSLTSLGDQYHLKSIKVIIKRAINQKSCYYMS